MARVIPPPDPTTDPTRGAAGGAAGGAARPTGSPYAQAAERVGRYRWTIVALLFFATTINYMDRQVLGILAPTLQQEVGWSELEYSHITKAFTFAYAVGFLGVGRMLDRIGVRKGFTIAIVTWSIAAMAHALARTAFGFGVARAALGLGESGNFPGAIKATAEWFPKKERAFATGIFNAGSNVGAILTPLVVPWITLAWGWRWAFIVVGAIGFVWLAFWLALYRSPESHPRVTPAELAYIRSDPPEPTRQVAWGELLGRRQTWAFLLGKALTDPVWWFYLFWLPKFLDAQFGVKLAGVAAPLITIYLMADVGSVGGGWLGSTLQTRGWSPNRARKTALLVPALCVVPTMFTPAIGAAGGLWAAVAIVSVAAASHQAWSANLFTLTSDMFPRRDVGTLVGLGGAAGALGGWLFQRATGRILEATGSNYAIIFAICGLAYVTAWGMIHLLAPRLAPVTEEPAR